MVLHGFVPVSSPFITSCRYEWVWALKRDFPHLQFSLNGGVMGCYEAAAALSHRQPASGHPSHHQSALHGPPHETYGNGHAELRPQNSAPNGNRQPESPHQEYPSSNGHGDVDRLQSSVAHCHQTVAQPAESDAAELQGEGQDSGDEGGLCGVMIGRAAYNSPWECLSDADRAVFGASSNPAKSRRQVCALLPRRSLC